MKLNSSPIALLLLMFAGGVASSAEVSPTSAAPVALSIEECLRIADETHPALTAAQAGVAAAAEAVSEARAPFYPQVDLSAGYHRWQRRAFLPSGLTLPGRGIPEVVGPLHDWNGGLQSRVLLYDSGERAAGLSAAQARRAGAEADVAVVRADLRLGVRAAYYALAVAQDLRVLAEKNLARAESHQRLAEARRAAGAVPQADVLRAQAEVAAGNLQLIGAASRVRAASGRLNTAMGRAADTAIQIAGAPAMPPPPGQAELSVAVSRALAHRPELKSGAKRAEAARATVSAARAARAPKVRADGAFGWRDTEWLPDSREWQAGLAVDFPVFDAGSRARRLARSQAELAREEAALEHRRLQVREEVWSTAVELERAWASIAANETNVRASEESLRVVRERYQLGGAILTDLIDTQTALARAEASLAETRWSYLTARAAFERAVGGAEDDYQDRVLAEQRRSSEGMSPPR